MFTVYLAIYLGLRESQSLGFGFENAGMEVEVSQQA